jgi:hypothetical protein
MGFTAGNGRVRISAHEKRKLDLAMSLRELSIAYGLTYARICKLRECAGFPILEGVVVPSDFDRWREEYYRRPRTSLDLPFQTDHTFGELFQSYDSPDA